MSRKATRLGRKLAGLKQQVKRLDQMKLFTQ